MNQINVAGLKIDALTKQELLDEIKKRVLNNQKTFITTPYSEFLYHALQDPELMKLLNGADIAVPDGMGILWAAKFLQISLTAKSYWGKIAQTIWQMKYSLAAILFYPQWIKTIDLNEPSPQPSPKGRGSITMEKISGSDLIWDLAKLAADNHIPIYLLGGFGDTPKIVADKLAIRNPQLKISGYSNKHPDDPTILDDLKKASPDLLFVAYGPFKQERWIAQNLPNLPVKLAIGLGGTFDYIAGKRLQTPKFMRKTGLEWLWRLFTQPHRAKRIWQATFGLVSEVLLYKLCHSLPYRKNVVSVIVKNKNLVFIARRNPDNKKTYARKNEKNKYLNYWQLPQGGVGKEESVTEAAKREAEEETGIKKLKPIKISDSTNQYDFSPSWKRLFDPFYRYKGQIQNIVYFEFLDEDKNIKIDKNELIGYQWAAIGELDKIVHPERINLVKIVQADLKNLA